MTPRKGFSSNRVVAEVEIRRQKDDVYAFVSDPTNMPRFLGDVIAVDIVGPNRSRWTIGLPLGLRTHWISEIVEAAPGVAFGYRTKRASWRLTFSARGTSTVVREEMTIAAGPLTSLALRIARKHPRDEVRSNLHRLQQLLEQGRVDDNSNALPGRF